MFRWLSSNAPGGPLRKSTIPFATATLPYRRIVVSLNFMNTDTFGPAADFSTSAFVWVFDAEWL